MGAQRKIDDEEEEEEKDAGGESAPTKTKKT